MPDPMTELHPHQADACAPATVGSVNDIDEPDDDELKPCPFCGGDATQINFDDAKQDGDNFGGSCISCKWCGASSAVHFSFKENLLSSWNERVTADRPAEQPGGQTARPVAWVSPVRHSSADGYCLVGPADFREGWRRPEGDHWLPLYTDAQVTAPTAAPAVQKLDSNMREALEFLSLTDMPLSVKQVRAIARQALPPQGDSTEKEKS